MPYTVGKHKDCPANKPHAVINKANGRRMGCHETRDKALKQQRALYANEAAALAVQQGRPVGWISDIAFEGVAAIDGRFIVRDALSWRDLPLTLMAMTVNSGQGHVGSYVAGRIEQLSKHNDNMEGEALPEGVVAVRGTGVFDTQGENGAEVARLVGDETLRGISVDMHADEIAFRDPDTGELLDPEQMDEEQLAQAFFGDLQPAFVKATIVAATVCPTPAFDDARISLVASSNGTRLVRFTTTFELQQPAEPVLTAAAVRRAPRSWFSHPEAAQPTPLTITPEGHVYGHAFLWNSCHTGYAGRCVTPPRSASNYAYYMTGELETLEGERVTVGNIAMQTGHADLGASWSAAKSHYDNTGTVVADVVIRDGKLGGWICGALRDVPAVVRDELAACGKLSGDWRGINGKHEMIGLLAVNVAGYPVPRPAASLVAAVEGEEEDELLALVAAGQFDRNGSELSDEQYLLKVEVLTAAAAADPVTALLSLVDGTGDSTA